MSEQKPKPGTIIWSDLTVADAEGVSEFYRSVVGWETSPVEMKGYSDFNLIPEGEKEGVAGLCHARGPNTDLPSQWLMYVVVDDVEKSAAKCRELGGEVVTGPRAMGGGKLCVVQDPAGAVLALCELAID